MKNKKIIMYFVVTFLWSWIIWTPFVLPYFNVYPMNETLEGLLMLAIMLGAFGPLVSAVIVTRITEGKGKIKPYFKRCFDFKVKWQIYVFSIVIAFGITMLAHFGTEVLGLADLPDNLFPEELTIPVWILVVPYTVMIMVLGGGQEEFGWRGFAQDPLQEKVGVLYSSLLIGLLWGLWHAPLWLIEGEGHSYYPFIAFLLYTTSWSVTIGVLYNISGKKMIIPWILHTVSNVSVPFFPILFSDHVPQPGYWMWIGVNTVVAILSYIYYNYKFLPTTI